MPDTHGNTFQHRHKRNGGYESICCTCFLTVASVNEKSELHRCEQVHSCDPIQLFEVTEYSRRVYQDLQRITLAANTLMSIARGAQSTSAEGEPVVHLQDNLTSIAQIA
jgi:hypothetical protein